MTFGRCLVDHPLMANVLADLALEAEAAMLVALDLAQACETDAGSSLRAAARIVTPAAKFWICKRASAVAAEAMEVLGGNGYIEESPLPRFYREAPVNSIWEGSGNIVALDVQRAMRREPEGVDALLASLASARGHHGQFDHRLSVLESLLRERDAAAGSARHIAELIAVTVGAAQLIRHAPSHVADAYCASRLANDGPAAGGFGTLQHPHAPLILARALA